MQDCLSNFEDGMESIAIPRLGTGIGHLPRADVASIMFHLASEFDKLIETWTLSLKRISP